MEIPAAFAVGVCQGRDNYSTNGKKWIRHGVNPAVLIDPAFPVFE